MTATQRIYSKQSQQATRRAAEKRGLACDIDTLDAVTPLGELALVEPGGRRLRDAFLNPLNRDGDADYPVVWTHETNQRRTMSSFVDFNTEPKPAQRKYATEVLWPKASRLLISCKINPQAIRVSSIHLPQAALGQPFVPITPLPIIRTPAATLKAWCAYLNSTPAVVSFMNRRQKKLTYADYSLDQLRSMPVPDPAKCDLTPLVSAYDRLGHSELEPWPLMTRCPVRAALDRAVADVLAIDAALLADWRERIASEPTISNKPAPPVGAPDPFIAHLKRAPLDGVDLERDRSPARDIEL